MSEEPRPVSKLRHWKQQFSRNASFMWRKNVVWNGESVVAGTRVSDEIRAEMGDAKLRRFWESGYVELWLWDAEEPHANVEQFQEPAPPAPVALPDDLGVFLIETVGDWYEVVWMRDGHDDEATRVEGREALDELFRDVLPDDVERARWLDAQLAEGE